MKKFKVKKVNLGQGIPGVPALRTKAQRTDDYATRRKERPGIKRLGQSPEALSRKSKPAGTKTPWPKGKIRNRLSGISQLETRLARRATAKAIMKRILGRVVPPVAIAADIVEVTRAGIEGVKALQARKELRDLETATIKSMARPRKRVSYKEKK